MSKEDLHYVCDDKVVVYKRANSRTSCWYARVRLDHNNRWKKFSTKTEDLNSALKFAETQYHVFKELLKSGVALESRRFSYVAELAIKEMEQELKAGRGKATYYDYIRIINRYKDFFGNKFIGNITYQDLLEFDQERSAKLGRKANQSTINTHNSALNRVFDEAIRRGWLHQSQAISLKNDGRKTERRSYFELHEYSKLYRFMRSYVKLTTKDSAVGGVKARTLMVRELLRDLVLFLANTGLRYGTESRSLKWKHVTEEIINGERYLKINLEKGKTGGRVIIARHNVRRYLNRLKDRFEHLKNKKLGEMKDVDEFIFRLRDGTFAKDLHGVFQIMIDKAGLLCDANGRKRSLYSLRHTYATFQILYSKIDLHLLAKNMGTSIGMLEKHYSHLEVLHRADILAGRSDIQSAKRRASRSGIKASAVLSGIVAALNEADANIAAVRSSVDELVDASVTGVGRSTGRAETDKKGDSNLT